MFDFYEPVKVRWCGYMDEVVCNGDDLILNSLFDFKPMKGVSCPPSNVARSDYS